jgi:hypothetical protein
MIGSGGWIITRVLDDDNDVVVFVVAAAAAVVKSSSSNEVMRKFHLLIRCDDRSDDDNMDDDSQNDGTMTLPTNTILESLIGKQHHRKSYNVIIESYGDSF